MYHDFDVDFPWYTTGMNKNCRAGAPVCNFKVEIRITCNSSWLPFANLEEGAHKNDKIPNAFGRLLSRGWHIAERRIKRNCGPCWLYTGAKQREQLWNVQSATKAYVGWCAAAGWHRSLATAPGSIPLPRSWASILASVAQCWWRHTLCPCQCQWEISASPLRPVSWRFDCPARDKPTEFWGHCSFGSREAATYFVCGNGEPPLEMLQAGIRKFWSALLVQGHRSRVSQMRQHPWSCYALCFQDESNTGHEHHEFGQRSRGPKAQASVSGNVFSAEVGWEAKFQSPSDLDKDAAWLLACTSCTRNASVVAS